MIKPLIKKQFLQLFAWLFVDRKTGKSRKGGKLIGFSLLYAMLFVYLGVMFYKLAEFICQPFASSGLGWFYFIFMGLIGVVAGVFGSVFNTYASLYNPKDNDLLLSMPISSSAILFSRLLGVYVLGLVYELVVMVPVVIVWCINVKLDVLGIVFSILIPFVLSLLVLALSCVLGLVVAIISSHIKRKNIAITAVSLSFFALYYYGYSKIVKLLQELIANPTLADNNIKNILYPFYKMGLAANGDVKSMLIFTVIVVAVLFAVLSIMSRTFLKIVIINKGNAKKAYKGNREKSGNLKKALLKKEMRRFLSSPIYMLNCGMGSIMMLVAAVFIIIKRDMVNDILNMFSAGSKETAWLVVASAIAMIGTTNDITAPSVSLEGKHLWILKMLPVSARQVLFAKLKFHLCVSLLPMLILAVTAVIVAKMSVAFSLLTVALSVMFVFFTAVFGLVLNIKMPNFEWKNETVPIKQSASVTIALFGGWGIVLALALSYYYLLKDIVTPVVFLIIALLIVSIVSVALFLWIYKKGAEIFSKF